MEDFGGRLDPVEWRSAFESDEPHDANRTMVVTGDHSADAFMTMFQVKVILSGIGHAPTLEGISVALGEFDRKTVSSSLGRSEPDG